MRRFDKMRDNGSIKAKEGLFVVYYATYDRKKA